MELNLQIHLDLVGGLAGDMFIAALLDAFPHLEPQVLTAIRQFDGSTLDCSLAAHRDQVLQGKRFNVWTHGAKPTVPFAESHVPQTHVTWSSLRSRIDGSSLPDRVRCHAQAIFSLLAEAEAYVHGIAIDDVQFHEVGAWDSIADIVGAATLIDALDVTRWTTSPVPLGSGRVMSAHGLLPVPAPATARLLLGMPTVDDGIPGERVTPTGAAILRHLCLTTVSHVAPAPIRTLTATGTGFGTRILPGISNHLRVLCFQKIAPVKKSPSVHVLEFDVDDLSGEELATGVGRLRANRAVLDIVQYAVLGKKGRMMTTVRLMVREPDLDEAIQACFRETTTIGVRFQTVQRVELPRRLAEVDVDGHRVRVKVVDRPGGATAKTESDDASSQDDHVRRASLRRRAEAAVLRNHPTVREIDA